MLQICPPPYICDLYRSRIGATQLARCYALGGGGHMCVDDGALLTIIMVSAWALLCALKARVKD